MPDQQIGSEFLKSLGAGGDSSLPAPTESTPSSNSGAIGSNFLASLGGDSPNNGQPSSPSGPTQHLYQDSSQPWYKRAWDWANTPITESLFGLPEDRPGAGGFERGVEHVVSGLTSPLSLALTAATFGGGGLIESAGATALKESGEFAAEEIPGLAKAAKAAVQATRDMAPGDTAVADAVKATGVDPARWQTAQDLLYKNGLSEHDLIGGNGLENGAFHVLHKYLPTTPIAVTVRAAKTANAVMNAGFTLQQLQSAAAMSPRFLDALKSGDYDKALEYGTEFAAGAGLGVAGAGHALSAWGELTEPLLSTKLKPSDTTVAIQRAFGDKEALAAVGEQEGITGREEALKLLGHKPVRPILGDTPEAKAQKQADLDLLEIYHQNDNPELAGAKRDALKRAIGQEVEPRPDNGQTPGLPANIEDMIRDNKFKDQSPEYQQRVINAYDRVAKNDIPDNVRAASDYLRKFDGETFEIGNQSGVLGAKIENHIHRRFVDNPEGRLILAEEKQGKFATSTSAAQQRVYDSDITAFLKSPKEVKLDPVNSVAEDRVAVRKAAANKQWLATIMDKGFKDSTGRPVAFLNGTGKVVSGENGEDPRIFIKANQPNFRSVHISDAEIERLSRSGQPDAEATPGSESPNNGQPPEGSELSRFLNDGTIRDITPKVNPKNIGAAIDRLENEAQRKEAQYSTAPEGEPPTGEPTKPFAAVPEPGEPYNVLRQKIAQLQEMQRTGDYSGLKEFNEAQKKLYAWNPQNYIALAQDAVKGWNFVTNTPEGTPVYVHSDVLVSPEYAQYFKNRLGLDESGLAKNPVGKALLGAGTKLKETLLSLSPFHMVQEALRALMVGVNPFHMDAPDILTGAKVDPTDPNSPTKQYVGVQNGLNLGRNYRAEQGFSEGVASAGGLLSKIPVVGQSMGWFQNFLFQKYIPGLAARGYELMFDRYKEAHPDWSVDHVAKAAAQHTNDTFGMLDYKKFGRSAATQDWMRLLTLAPSWLESELRSGARLFNKDEGGIGREQIAKMSMALWGAARVLNMVSTGSPHLEAPFGLAIKNKEGKETIFGIRTLPTDLLHAASDPVGFLKGRLSPTFRTAQELISQRDQFGRKLGPQDLWADIFRNTLPIPGQALGQAITNTGPEVGNVGQLWKAAGGTAQSYASPAQKMASELAADHTESGPIDPAQMARHRTIMGFEDRLRAGEMSLPDIYKMYASGELEKDDLRKITENAKKTEGMSSDIASLYTRASRLPGEQYLQLYDTMNPTERTALLPLTLQVRKKYIAKAMKNLRPEERLRDPAFVRYLNMAPEQSPF